MIKLLLKISLRTGVSLFSRSVVRNVRDTKIITHVTDGARRGRGEIRAMSLFSSGAATLASRVSWLLALEWRPLIFVYLYVRTQSIQKQIVKYDIKSKYPEKYSTVDKVGRERLLERKSCFV